VPLFGSITGSLRQDIDIGVTNTDTQSVQCISVARTNDLISFKATLHYWKKTVHFRYPSIKMFRTATCPDYPSSYNFDCNKWLL